MILDGLKNVFRRNNCGYHDWEAKGYRHGPPELRVTSGHSYVKVKRKKAFVCRHEGCEATKEEWVTVDRDDNETETLEDEEAVLNKPLREFL